MNCLDWLILTLIDRFDGQRSAGGIFHLLKGKRSAQTLQDTHLFNLSPFVCSYRELEHGHYISLINNYDRNGIININGKNIKLSNKGKNSLYKLDERFHLPVGYDGSRFEWTGVAPLFWERLSLTIQTVTFLMHGHRSFIPISYRLETQNWVKDFLKLNHFALDMMSEKIYEETANFLLKIPSNEANLFVHRLTTPLSTGKTFHQLSETYENDPTYTKIYFQSVIHRFIKALIENPVGETLLLQMVDEKSVSDHIVTDSAKETKILLDKGLAIEIIQQIRGLKRSTIEDHLIELALHSHDFPYDSFISNKEIQEVLFAAKQLSTKRLRVIKDSIGNRISYFQIRLALTKMKEGAPVGPIRDDTYGKI